MTNLIDEITQELIGTMGAAVKDLSIEDFDALEYENVCHDFEITLDVAKEVFPQALAKAKVAVEEIEAELNAIPEVVRSLVANPTTLFDPISGRYLKL